MLVEHDGWQLFADWNAKPHRIKIYPPSLDLVQRELVVFWLISPRALYLISLCLQCRYRHRHRNLSVIVPCHSGFVPPRKCSGGNISASVGVPPGTFPHSRIRSGPRKCSAYMNLPNERARFCLKALGMLTSVQSMKDPKQSLYRHHDIHHQLSVIDYKAYRLVTF